MLRLPCLVLCALVSLGLTACFGYAPVEPGAVPPGSEVRAHLTRAALLDLPDIRLISEGSAVSGTLRAQDDRVTVLFVSEGVVVEGALQRTIGRDISISTNEIILLEQRQLRSGRTALAVAGGIGVLAILAASVQGTNTPVQLPPEPGPQESRHSFILSIPIGMWFGTVSR